MTAVALPRVTLCCVDCTPRLPWAIEALRRCMSEVSFGDVVLCTDRGSLQGNSLPKGVRWDEIAPLQSIESYSEFMIKELGSRIRTSHVLVVQWDGFVVNAAAWRDEFLEFDYIGAPWNHIPAPWTVGNGGFSLRSRRLLEALQSPDIHPSHPEDLCICQTHRAVLEAQGIRFAPVVVAQQFAVEDGSLSADVFGFHGPYHLPALLAPADLLKFVESLEPAAIVLAHYFGSLLREMRSVARSGAAYQPAWQAFRRLVECGVDRLQGPASLTPQALGLCKALIRHSEYGAAGRLLRQRRLALGRRWAEPRLWTRMRLKALVAGWRKGGG